MSVTVRTLSVGVISSIGSLIAVAAVAPGCGSENSEKGFFGGASSMGAASDMSSGGRTSQGGAATGGTAQGGVATGGTAEGGTAEGGTAEGGAGTGGAATASGSSAGSTAQSGGSSGATSSGGRASKGGAGGASAGSTAKGGGGAGGGAGCDAPNLVWKSANKTNYTSYPDPGSEECIKFNGCMWEGQFAACSGKKSEDWVAAHNIVAAFPDFRALELHDLCLRKGTKSIVVTVLDTCGDSDCDGCCTENKGNADQLIDIESYTNERWGVSDGSIEWADLGPTKGGGCD
jgi:hypothetical protein